MQRDRATRHKYEISHSKRFSRTLKVVTIAGIRYAVYGNHFLLVPVVTTSLSNTVSEILPLFYYMWLSVTLRCPSSLTIRFKSQAACVIQFMCKRSVVKIRYIFSVMGITKVYNKKWQWASLKVIGNRAIRQAIDNFLWVFHCNYVSILHDFQYIIDYFLKFKYTVSQN